MSAPTGRSGELAPRRRDLYHGRPSRGGPIGSRRPKRILLRSSIVPCFEAAEFYLRAFEFQKSETQIHRNSPTMYIESDLIKLEPGFRRQRRKKEFGVAGSINSLHHRQSEFEIAKGDWTRVLVLGGSFTFGWGVEAEQSCSHLLAGHLDGASSRKIEVINAGYTAGTCSDAHYLRRSAWSVDIRILGELGQGVRPRRGHHGKHELLANQSTKRSKSSGLTK